MVRFVKKMPKAPEESPCAVKDPVYGYYRCPYQRGEHDMCILARGIECNRLIVSKVGLRRPWRKFARMMYRRNNIGSDK